MCRLALPCGITVGLILSTSAWAQIDYGSCPLVHVQQQDLYVVTYDGALFTTSQGAQTLDEVCSADAPCDSSVVVVDTPLWREEDADLEAFRRDLREIFEASTNEQVFLDEPQFIFTNLGNDPTTSASRYESVIIDEANDAGMSVVISLP